MKIIKINTDTVIIGNEVSIKKLENEKDTLQIMQKASQIDRDEYNALPDKIKEKMYPAIDFSEEIIDIDKKIKKYKKMNIGEN